MRGFSTRRFEVLECRFFSVTVTSDDWCVLQRLSMIGDGLESLVTD